MRLSPHTLGTIVAIAGVLANVLAWQLTETHHNQEAESRWQQAVEARLTRLETKMDRLLSTTTAALDLADRKLPKTH